MAKSKGEVTTLQVQIIKTDTNLRIENNMSEKRKQKNGFLQMAMRGAAEKGRAGEHFQPLPAKDSIFRPIPEKDHRIPPRDFQFLQNEVLLMMKI